jgi:hypothetical protein
MYNVGMDQHPTQRRPCERCGETDWIEASDDQYAAITAQLRAQLRDLGEEADFQPPKRVFACQACGGNRMVLTTTFA